MKLDVSLSIDEAVAMMVNMDFIPEGETAVSMTRAFFEEASVELENAYGVDKFQRKVLENRMQACEARHNLAVLLRASLLEDALYTEDTAIECDDKSTDENPLVTLDSLINWSYDRFGIGIPSKHFLGNKKAAKANSKKPYSWQDVTIKIYADYRLGFRLGDNNFKQSSFRDIGLMGERKITPNELGGILIGLSLDIKFPRGKTIEAKDKTSVSKLKKALIKLTGLDGEPFYRPDELRGYRPRFKLIDDTKNADERAKKEAKHVSYEDHIKSNEYSYEREGDDADAYIESQK